MTRKSFISEGARNHAWTKDIPEDQWDVYLPVLDELKKRQIPYALGGAFAVAACTQRWRNTKDLDIYICPDHREEVISILGEKGMQDYYDVLPYDRDWIYRSYKGDIIIDAMWAMANQRTQVDEGWLGLGEPVEVRGVLYRALPPEELVWAKIYVLQRERSDWTDVFNIIHAAGPRMDWDCLLDRMEEDLPLLRGVLSVFAWLDPSRARQLSGDLWGRLHLPEPEINVTQALVKFRASLLDTRPWFLPLVQIDD